MQKFTGSKNAPTLYFPARNACFSGTFLRFALQNFVKKHHFALEMPVSERFSWGITPGCISGQKTAFRTGNSGAKQIEDIVKKLGNLRITISHFPVCGVVIDHYLTMPRTTNLAYFLSAVLTT